MVALCVVALFFCLSYIGNRRLKKTPPKISVLGAAPTADPWQAARDLAAGADFTRAFLWLFIAHVCDLGRRGLVTLHESKTTLHYELDLQQAGFVQMGEYRELRSLFNAARYGRAEVEPPDFDHWLSYCLGYSQGGGSP
jgi:hypothetical protein